MNLFKKIDNYLLHNFPNIWVTKVHVFFPIAIIFMLIIYVFNVYIIGYNIKNPFPEGEWGVTLMIIPVIIFIVYWFVIQARYNVEKSGGKLSIPLEYMNFFLYFLMFATSYILISFIPFTNDIKIANTANRTEIQEDIKNLNLGNNLINNSENIEMSGNRYKIRYSQYINSYYWNDIDFTEEAIAEAVDIDDIIEESTIPEDSYYMDKLINYEDYLSNSLLKSSRNIFVLATKNQLIDIAERFITSYNKYTVNEINVTPKYIVENELRGNKQDYNLNYYSNSGNNYNYNYWRNRVNYKVEYIAKLKIQNSGAFEANYGNNEFSKLVLSWLLMMSLMVWIFKQIHWRDYIFGLLALVLTPVVTGIVGVFFGVFMNADENFFFTLVFLAYAIAIFFTLKGFTSRYKSRFSIVTAMYLHIWLPIIPIFYYFFMYEVYYRRNYELRRQMDFDNIFFISVIIGLISIGLFKIIYKKMRLLPNHK